MRSMVLPTSGSMPPSLRRVSAPGWRPALLLSRPLASSLPVRFGARGGRLHPDHSRHSRMARFRVPRLAATVPIKPQSLPFGKYFLQQSEVFIRKQQVRQYGLRQFRSRLARYGDTPGKRADHAGARSRPYWLDQRWALGGARSARGVIENAQIHKHRQADIRRRFGPCAELAAAPTSSARTSAAGPTSDDVSDVFRFASSC